MRRRMAVVDIAIGRALVAEGRGIMFFTADPQDIIDGKITDV